MELKDLCIEELQTLKDNITIEIIRREDKILANCIYTHDCYGSSQYHFGKCKHYAKVLDKIDNTKTDGYAFVGDFLKCDKENLIKKGKFVIEVCSVTLKIYRVVGDKEKELIIQGRQNEICSFIKEAKKLTSL